jgi:hypothetical protein
MAQRWELIADRNADAAEGASENARRVLKLALESDDVRTKLTWRSS